MLIDLSQVASKIIRFLAFELKERVTHVVELENLEPGLVPLVSVQSLSHFLIVVPVLAAQPFSSQLFLQLLAANLASHGGLRAGNRRAKLVEFGSKLGLHISVSGVQCKGGVARCCSRHAYQTLSVELAVGQSAVRNRKSGPVFADI